MATRVPISTASRKGVSWLTERAREEPVTLTSFGKPSAVVISAAEVDRVMESLRKAAAAVVASYAAKGLEKHPATVTFDEVVEQVGNIRNGADAHTQGLVEESGPLRLAKQAPRAVLPADE